MKRIVCLFYRYQAHWLGINNVRSLRRNAPSSPSTSMNGIVKLRSNRYNYLITENTSAAVIENESWAKKLQYAAACYQANTEDALNTVVSLAREDCEKKTSTANRLLYLAMDMALNQNRIDVAEEMCELLPRRVHILAVSLKIRFFVRQKRFSDALCQVEKVLNEDTACLDVSKKISKSVMDEFFRAISSCDDAVDEAKRFFTLQRLLSKYNKLTKKTLRELLLSDMFSSRKGSIESSLKIDNDLLDKIVKHVPEFLTDDRI
uniref:Uncharacterized protein n=1 Tax=Setaria digitata TaxID=48799 RepID=A0A915PXU9_9BILA